ncbi:MAG: 16S rRNA (cytidine(1402)-2'-O)-methyltransferase, partial [Bradyrhizobium sp.]
EADGWGVTLVAFESPKRLPTTLAALAARAPERPLAVCRELTKLHEEVKRAPVAELAANADALETRGEFVLVIGPPADDAGVMDENAHDDLLRAQLARGSVKDAVAHAVELSGRPRREVYARALELAKTVGDGDGQN